ncbi:hypothetical protein TNCV_4782321 [Trichonephila clavipes]|nr:hypothetical protein TNCV_4782321 [Trichonephila clavipes]
MPAMVGYLNHWATAAHGSCPEDGRVLNNVILPQSPDQILLGQVTQMTSELKLPLQTTTPRQREDLKHPKDLISHSTRTWGHGTTPLRVKENLEDVSSELVD